MQILALPNGICSIIQPEVQTTQNCGKTKLHDQNTESGGNTEVVSYFWADTTTSTSTHYIYLTITDVAGNTKTTDVMTITPTTTEDVTETYVDTATDYTGYYADVDGDGEVDGIIFADLAFSKSGINAFDGWNILTKSRYRYSYTAITEELNTYIFSGETYTDTYFGTNYVITLGDTTDQADRFYVMGLEDITENDTSTFYWLYNLDTVDADEYLDNWQYLGYTTFR